LVFSGHYMGFHTVELFDEIKPLPHCHLPCIPCMTSI